MKNSEDYVLKVAQAIRQIRKDKGYTNYEDFAFEKGLPRAQFGRYETGTDLRISSLKKVVDAFDMSLSAFFKYIENMNDT